MYPIPPNNSNSYREPEQPRIFSDNVTGEFWLKDPKESADEQPTCSTQIPLRAPIVAEALFESFTPETKQAPNEPPNKRKRFTAQNRSNVAHDEQHFGTSSFFQYSMKQGKTDPPIPSWQSKP